MLPLLSVRPWRWRAPSSAPVRLLEVALLLWL
jgi:hypothetical protein